MRRGSSPVLVLPDLHAGHHEESAVNCAMKVGRKIKPRKTVILGDWLDAEVFSSHPKQDTREGWSYLKEVRYVNELLDEVQSWSGEVVFISGNHCHRIRRYLAQSKASELFDLVSPETLLSEGRDNFTFVPYNKGLAHHKIADGLIAVHGWGHSVHAAAAVVNKSRPLSVVFGHTHRIQLDTRRVPYSDKPVYAWSVGCLAKVQQEYAWHSPGDHLNGLGILWVKNDGSSWDPGRTCLIQNGKTRIEGGEVIKG